MPHFQLRYAPARRLVVLGVVSVFLPGSVVRPQAPGPRGALTSAARALALIDSAIAVHGGMDRLRAIEDLTIRYRGRRWMAYQSMSLARPWATQPTLTDVVIDFKNNRLMQHRVSHYPVDFAFTSTQITTPQQSWFWDPTRAGFGDAVAKFQGASVANHQLRRELPAFELMEVRNRPESVRWVGEETAGGRRLQGVSYAQPNGAVYTLWIDAGTKRLSRLEWLRDDAVDGDQVASYEYSDYRLENDISVPSRLVERRNGELIRDDTLTYAFNTRPVETLFVPPSSGFTETTDFRPPGVESEPVRKLAENVWLLQQLPGGNRVMFVAFRDHVLVFEAPTPQGAATAVLDAVRRTVPGKPVRYVTFSHHHDDHGGGLRPYIADGITIVTTPKNRAFVEHVANARHTLRPDVLSRSPRAPVIETFSRKRVFTDGEMTVELHDIGPTSHVDEIVMAYLPREKLVFQGDLLILPDRGQPAPANTLAAEFAKAIERLGLDVQAIAGVHGRVGTLADLREAVSKRGP